MEPEEFVLWNLTLCFGLGNEAPDSIKLSEGFSVMGKQPLCIC